MDIRHLRYFIAVAEELSFTRASQRLHIAQPPLSRQVRTLEQELGVALLARTSRSVRLTAAGQVLLAEGKALMSQMAGVEERTRRAGNGASGCVRVGFATGLGDALQGALERHMGVDPDAEVHFKSILSAEQSAALRDGTIDIGLMRPPFDHTCLEGETLYQERLVVLLPRRHRLAKARKIALEELDGQTILLHKRGASVGMYDKVMELLREAHIRPKLVQTRTGPYEQEGTVLVASGQGVYIAGGSAISHPGASREVRAIPLSDPGATIGICIAWRKNEQAPNVLAFLQSMRAVLQKTAV